ncbi:MAG: hypothetical protein JKX68_12515 [Flavobacteriales bacterium]|nr:hypothetical protein [Flavobacteriales bacterium]
MGEIIISIEGYPSVSKKNKKIRVVHIDLFNLRNEHEFYEFYAQEILKVTYTKWEERIEKSKTLFKQIIPKFSLGLDPDNDFSIGFNWDEIKKNPSEILNLPELISKSKNLELVICLDEFQNIAHFKNPLAFQKKLRAHWQHHQKVSYCLYGSKRNMMTELFENKSMPFYKFGDIIFLKKIENKHWVNYICKKFKQTGKEINKELASLLASTVSNHPYFVQQFANVVWRNTAKICTEKIVEESINELVDQYDLLFQKEVDGLTNTQLEFLRALLDNVKQMSTKKTLANYKMGTSANVIRVKNALVSKEVIDLFGGEINFLDPLFEIWLKTVYFN